MIANILFIQSGDLKDSRAVDFLKSSFVSGDREHWGRFVRAAHAYVIGEFAESERLFDDLGQRAPDDFKPKLRPEHRWLSAAAKDRRGKIAKNFGTYFLITPTTGPDRLFAPSWATDEEVWETLGVQSQVSFDLGFNRRGPFGRNVRMAAK